jgi:putative oxidoreductase
MDLALLGLRLVVGLTLAAHGGQKLFGWFGGHGIEGTGASYEGIGLRPGRLNALLAGMAESSGGLLIALGLLTPWAPRN